jgi:hypothetical protein
MGYPITIDAVVNRTANKDGKEKRDTVNNEEKKYRVQSPQSRSRISSHRNG